MDDQNFEKFPRTKFDFRETFKIHKISLLTKKKCSQLKQKMYLNQKNLLFHFFEMFKKIFDFIFRCCVEIIIKEYHCESDK